MPIVGALAVTWVLVETRRWPAAGVGRQRLWATLGWTAALVVLVAGIVDPVLEPLVDRLTGTPVDYSGYGALRGNLPMARDLVLGAWLSATLGEELVFRAFLMHQLTALLRTTRAGDALAILAGGVVFGLMHADQGLAGIVLTGLVGGLFCAAYLRSGRNLWALVLAHGLIDTWGVTTLYLGWV
ncbi:CPBP family intramembrane glutamic endopeptidase [Luteimonas sp. TWI1416]|uniref:CPBP family intramembrane glutamic endopeptidase n=1 Tax=unclassified Luteimonas TaxID=2629088 RepID=UPI00320AEF40